MSFKPIPPEIRFWPKVQKTDTCWLWQAYIDECGYGRFSHNGKWIQAHRFLIGAAPEGMVWDHLCRVRHCVNPAHLEAVTPRENTQRGVRGRLKTHCAQGHRWVPENLVWGSGRRFCKPCRQARAAAVDPEANRARALAHYYANREKKLAYQREYTRRKRAERSGAPS